MRSLAFLLAFIASIDYKAHGFLNQQQHHTCKSLIKFHRGDGSVDSFQQSSIGFQREKTHQYPLHVHHTRSGSFPPSDLPQPASRRTFIVSTFSFGLISGALVGVGMTANAKYGEGTNMELPSYIDYLIEKNTARDTSGALYQGVDPTTLLQRLSEAESRLQQVPTLAQQQKWTQINGLVTGPLGTLSVTLNQIATASNASTKTKEFAKQVKADVLAIGQGATTKNADACIKQAALASQDLKSLLQEAFE
ncbi:hypothetical protein IV203_004959 [Nitzschia inconspicua]|uniref:Uncharacterized protein n=1 Tax=Nitzschia inconspicua TaxID=303405 RepID=A0A9K3KLF4_9STRA|nr:hypothetical protein IV203_004959 [Nitzschia inconspicua]